MAGERRRESFDGAAADYGRYRTPYPDEVVSDVLHCSGIGTGTRSWRSAAAPASSACPWRGRGPTW